MLKSQIGYSISENSFIAGQETAMKATVDMPNAKVGFLYTSCKNNVSEVVQGVKNITDTQFIGCTSSGSLIVPDGVIESENGFAGMMIMDDPDMTVGVACHEAGKDARTIGRKVAIAAVENAKTTRAPAYFYMIAKRRRRIPNWNSRCNWKSTNVWWFCSG